MQKDLSRLFEITSQSLIMKTEPCYFKIIFLIFLILQTILFISILFVPHLPLINVFEYTSIILSLIFSLFVFLKKKNIFTLLIFIALIFTAVADTFLVFLNSSLNETTQTIAMISFSLCQLTYFLVIWKVTTSQRERFINLVIRTIFFLALEVTAICILGSSYNFLIFVSLFYFSQLVTNIIFAFIHIKMNPFLAIGLLLFIGCDIFIGLSTLCDILALSQTHFLYIFAHLPFNFAWFFYLPSQVLLSSSGLFFKRKLLISKNSL